MKQAIKNILSCPAENIFVPDSFFYRHCFYG
ncbi:hypothetical protein H206_05420 [Candidatus Electrothrix aarhusensis]|uniref:Uncharacterized protein n=1 Tax=Candidatus Electrothrix aarhusensis TaxID=1859131 RepID=A0A3S3QI23_9BACT|nr:hypothetical protein H206_05420 [Candidatus Electrothrix aarhusensis]